MVFNIFEISSEDALNFIDLDMLRAMSRHDHPRHENYNLVKSQLIAYRMAKLWLWSISFILFCYFVAVLCLALAVSWTLIFMNLLAFSWYDKWIKWFKDIGYYPSVIFTNSGYKPT